MSQIAILDVDGTLVDTNYHHAIAWYRAFRRSFITVPVWRLHRHIGMGGDQLVAAVFLWLWFGIGLWRRMRSS